MNSEDIETIKRHITKALGNSQERIVLDLLASLRSFKATTESLKATRIGVFVTDIRKHASATDRIKDASKDLIAKWKTDIGKAPAEAAPTAKQQGSSSSPTVVTHSKNGGEQEPGGPDTPATLNSPPVLERTVSSDGVGISSTGDKIRDKCIEMLYSALATGSDAASSKASKIASAIERGVYAEHKGIDAKYKSRIRSLMSNLKDKSNPELRQEILAGAISPESFAVMTSEEMMSKHRKEAAEKARKESMHVAVSAASQQAETDMFRCGRCGQRRTRYYQMQTRSADEPMTTFVTCLNCDNRWKFC